MSAARHEFMLMTVKGNKKKRAVACTVNTEAAEAVAEFMRSGTHAVQYCTCNMQKGTACPSRAVASCTCSKDKDTKYIKFDMHTCHAEFTCRAHKGQNAVQKLQYRSTGQLRHGKFLRCAGFCFSDYDAVALQGSWRHAHQGTSP